ncbi:GNAT family N-acetyltransferase [Ferdinandcohnia quinoae]|uniref:GNAT family N-acetyltransferase n=1 Tax=Fredinandcohnia quinoae TaxID=2918902 RepID=A0AAW5E3W4_9BACI|nr:GNAT family N-acetyltransferase [Fredinandcohnia sp. SECRCQ15]MCH1625940.1 GNAT family N-acetyltransferase [Fredinandcohnia sp. SECRCQ15]
MKRIETERLLLRSLKIEDAERVEELASDYDIAKTTLNIPHPYPEGSAAPFIKSMLEAEKENKMATFAIIEKSSSSLIGTMSIGNNTEHKRGELAYWIGKPYWGKGYGTEAAKAVIRYGFDEFGLQKVFAAAFTDNPGSWRIMEKIGMKHEGTLRNHVIKWGKSVDLHYYGILKEELK